MRLRDMLAAAVRPWGTVRTDKTSARVTVGRLEFWARDVRGWFDGRLWHLSFGDERHEVGVGDLRVGAMISACAGGDRPSIRQRHEAAA